MKHDPIYMEPRALEFLRQWPKVEPVLRPVYSRFYDAGLIWFDPNVDIDPDEKGRDFPGSMRLTERGQALKELVDAQSFNFFTVEQIAPLLVGGDLEEKENRIFKDDIPGVRVQQAMTGLKAALANMSVAFERLEATMKRANR